jgi:hypothetical protein
LRLSLNLKKFSLLIILLSFFFSSYFFKNFQLLFLSTTFFLLFVLCFIRISKNILLIVFSILFILNFIEITLYLKNHKLSFNLKKKDSISKNIKYEKTYLGYQPKAGRQNHLKISNGVTLIDNVYSIAEDGFRITPDTKKKYYKKIINFFGGSFTFGWGLNDDETLPYFFQKNHQNWKVKNYAISGYGIHQMLAQIENDINIIGDINILITGNFHIPRSACKRDYSFGTPKYIIDENNNLKRSGYCGNLLLKKIQLPKIFGSIINRSEIKKLFDKIFTKPKEINSRDTKIYLLILKKINKLIKQNNQEFIVGYIENDSNELDQMILKELNKENINYVNLTLKPNKEYVLYDGHPNKKANIERSKLISSYIKTLFDKMNIK